MKRFLLISFLLGFLYPLYAQEIKVHDIKQSKRHELNSEWKNDLNGEPCAMVNLNFGFNGFTISGNIVGNSAIDDNRYTVFLTGGSKFIIIRHPLLLPLEIKFKDYGIDHLVANNIYEIDFDISDEIMTLLIDGGENTNQLKTFKVNNVTFNMIHVKGGRFRMGATKEQNKPYDDEKPVHSVTLDNYYIGETEVTQALWESVMGISISSYNNTNRIFEKNDIGGNKPMYLVSWLDCQQFILKLNQITGEKFRLPSEAEWEYAARGGSKSLHTQYSGSEIPDNVAWTMENCGDKRFPHNVKSKNPNELGIYDMSGNITEWCYDVYGKYNNYASSNPIGQNRSKSHVVRGGSIIKDYDACRVSIRNNFPEDTRGLIGLRLALGNSAYDSLVPTDNTE